MEKYEQQKQQQTNKQTNKQQQEQEHMNSMYSTLLFFFNFMDFISYFNVCENDVLFKVTQAYSEKENPSIRFIFLFQLHRRSMCAK